RRSGPAAGRTPRVPAPSPQRRRLDRLWRRIYRRYGARPATETLRDYAARLSAASPEARDALVELVRRDEAIRYGAGGERLSRRWLDAIWRRVAKRPSRSAAGPLRETQKGRL
ncbi:DUF4129 domain-containing protein, partial [Paenibacillus sp.]|uniref:DUF4129 domain-containing protein n=1 Tax=Paenibacillus sp. TaxID=58172 RepID=UPI002D344CAE